MAASGDLRHHTVETNGIELHVAEIGEGPLVVLCHGFPESWYSWRHQLPALAEAGYRVVAPDQRGYGASSSPEAVEAYTVFHLTGDIVGLVHVLGESEAVIVGHDWGSLVAWAAALVRPDVFRAVASLSVPTQDRGPVPPMTFFRQLFDDRFFYQLYFQTPGVAEHELQHDVGVTMRKLLAGVSGSGDASSLLDVSGAPPASAYMLERIDDPGHELPSWLTADDLAYFVGAFETNGFRGPLNWYRNIDRNWELSAALQGKTIDQPALFVTGDADVVPFGDGAEAAMRAVVTDLRDVVVIPGVGHWTQQEAPDAVNDALLGFLGGL